MNDQTPASRSTSIRLGAVDSLGVGIGIFPLGVALGFLVIQAGLPWWLAPALSIGIFAGSVELLLVSMIAAATPLLTIAATVFALNFRHVFYPLSFPIQAVKPGILDTAPAAVVVAATYGVFSGLFMARALRLSGLLKPWQAAPRNA